MTAVQAWAVFVAGIVVGIGVGKALARFERARADLRATRQQIQGLTKKVTGQLAALARSALIVGILLAIAVFVTVNR
jgi:uncharacterized membrane-anchored protein YhcB (DUF1043 family)